MKSVVSLYWLTAARAGFAKPADWRAWADKQITSMPTPPYWIINMSLAMNLTDLRKALDNVLESLGETTPATVDDAMLGYIWWRFERNDLNLQDCLKLAGEAADASSSSISCETIFALLNQLEVETQKGKDIEITAKELLLPLRRLAEQQWMEIQSYA